MKIESKYLVLATLSAAIVAFDQLTKMYIHTRFGLGETLPVIHDYFNITYVRNPGAAFGIFRESHETFRKLFFLSMPPIAMVIIIALLRSVPSSDRLQVFALSLVFGGAIGNYIDRLRFGYVIDFLDFHWQHKYAWPAFNIADSCIVVGVILLVFVLRNPPSSTAKTS